MQPDPTPAAPATKAGRQLVEDEPRLVTGEHSMLARVLAIEAEAHEYGRIEGIHIGVEAEARDTARREADEPLDVPMEAPTRPLYAAPPQPSAPQALTEEESARWDRAVESGEAVERLQQIRPEPIIEAAWQAGYDQAKAEVMLAQPSASQALDFDALDLAIGLAYNEHGTAGVIREYARLSRLPSEEER